MVFRTEDSNHQCFVMAAILEFKMAATRFVRHFRLIHCWTHHVKIPYLANFSATGVTNLQFTVIMFNVSSWRPYWNSRWRPINWSYLLDPTIFELHMSKYLYMQNSTLSARCDHAMHRTENFSALWHLEPKIVMINVSSWRPYWNSKWRPHGLSDISN